MRITNFRKELAKKSLTGAVVSNVDNLFYLSGHLVTGGCGPALLLVPAANEPVLVVSEYDIALPSCNNFPGSVLSYPAGEPGVNSTADAAGVLAHNCRNLLTPPVGIEADSLSIGDAYILGISLDGEWSDTGSLIKDLRAIKDIDEIVSLKTACRIADSGQAKAAEIYKEGVSEITLQAAVRYSMETAAGRPIECKADVLIGRKTALIGGPAGQAGENIAGKSDPVIVDILPRVGGYFADTTRTLYAGPPSAEKKEVIALLISVKQDLEKMLAPGVEAKAIDSAARERLSKAGSFPHHTGHGIGISANEAPYMTPDSGDILREGMAITLEPGLYFDAWGARIEDDYLITGDGFERLTGLY
ncbi:MAG TPA: aminopeptidase P family protein [Spirochaetes bacterium]|nr:aminopeptidase P family protein [Spirochaetota bacterium]